MKHKMNNNEILTVKQVMAKLGLAYKTVLHLISEGSLEASWVKGKWLVQSGDLEKMLEKLKKREGRIARRRT